jgi:ankyrin repeat protein
MVMKMLIEADADVFMRDADGRTALSLAKDNSNDTAIRFLCQSGSLRHPHRREEKKAEERKHQEEELLPVLSSDNGELNSNH